jgi:hypothetical protein
MNDLTLFDDIDRLDTGITQDPDVSGIISAARRRRRRTRAIITAGGLATAAVVAPLALLVGGGTTTAPSTPGFAAEPAAAPIEELTDEQYEAQYAADMTAAVTESVPDAVVDMPIDSWGFGWVWGQTYTLGNGAHVGINSSFDRTMAGEGRRACDSEPDKTEIVSQCTETVVGDRVVRVAEGRFPGKDRILWRHVDVFPANDVPGPTVSVDASVMGDDASMSRLPSADALTAIALDQRVTPTRERGVIHPAPESEWGNEG